MTEMEFESLTDGDVQNSGEHFRQWLSNRNHYSIYFIVLYVLMVFGGQSLMQTRKPLPLSKAFLVWNLCLAVFSIAGTFSVFPEFLHTLKSHGFFASYCKINDDYYTGRNGYWVYLFHMSKLLELGDTLFLVFRKRPVIFLHWYHHATVLGYTWLTYSVNQGPSRWGIMMNFFVHALMYAYYAARSARLRCPRFVAPLITTVQLCQFVLGTYICVHSLYTSLTRGADACDVTLNVTVASIVIYLSYFLLFAKFFYHSYLDKSSGTNKLIGNGASKRDEAVRPSDATAEVENKKLD